MSDLFGAPQEERPGRLTPAVRRRRRLAALTVGAALLAVLVIVVVLVARWANGVFGSDGDYSGQGSGTVLVVIHDGDSISTIGHTLATDGVVRSASTFTSAAADDAKARTLVPGTYRLHHHMAAALALKLMLDPASLVDYRVTIPEGFTAADIVNRVAADTPITADALRTALGDPASLGLPSYANGHVEGFLFPATYDVQPGTTATQLLHMMVARFDLAAKTDNLLAGSQQIGFSPYQVLTLASIVQREGRLTTDFPKIAEVFVNRLHQGMRLDSDATLYYVLGPDHGPLTATDLANPSPYNTRLNHGLPPTPINSPGDAAIDAVLHHPTGPYLYFVTIDKAGHTAFAKTLDQFNALVTQSRANGVS